MKNDHSPTAQPNGTRGFPLSMSKRQRRTLFCYHAAIIRKKGGVVCVPEMEMCKRIKFTQERRQ